VINPDCDRGTIIGQAPDVTVTCACGWTEPAVSRSAAKRLHKDHRFPPIDETGERVSYGEFRCALCGGEFRKAWPEDEALEEQREVFGEVPDEERAVVCDDCYRRVMGDFDRAVAAAGPGAPIFYGPGGLN
jgi:hypothetical protein